MDTYTLITGASSGIGKDMAHVFVQNKHNVVITGRDETRLKVVHNELEQLGVKVVSIVQDLSTAEGPHQLFEAVTTQGIVLDVLVNNAGSGMYGEFALASVDEMTSLVNTNVRALTLLTRLFLPGMIERKRGKILNLSSIAAFYPGPLMAIYYASKAYVQSFSQGVAEEVGELGIHVSALCPGPTGTGFQSRSDAEHVAILSKNLMSSRDVAVIGYNGLMANKRVIVPGLRNKFFVFWGHVLPFSLSSKIMLWINKQKA